MNKTLLFRGMKYMKLKNLVLNLSKDDILEECAKKLISGEKLLEIPSFLLIQKALKKGLEESGIERVMNPESLNYDYV